MDPEAFRREGHRIVDWLADYLAAPEQYPVLSRIEARRSRARAAGGGSGRRRAVRRHLRGLRAARRPRPHALEPSRFLRLLRDQRQRSRHPRGDAQRRPQRAGDAVAHVAGGDRARAGHAALAGAADGTAVDVRGRHLRHRLDLDAARAGGGTRGGRARRARSRDARAPGPPRRPRLLLGTHALVHRQGRAAARTGAAGHPSNSRGPLSRDARRPPRRGDRRRSSRAGCVRWPSSRRSAPRRPPPSILSTPSPTSARPKASGCTSMPPTPA